MLTKTWNFLDYGFISYYFYKYFYLVVILQLSTYFFSYVIKNNEKVYKFIKNKSLLFKTLLSLIGLFTIYIRSINFNTQGWDRRDICKWTSLSEQYTNLNIYSVQFESNILKYNILEVPYFSSYYHPSMMSLFKELCNLSNTSYNLFSLSIYLIVLFSLAKILKNVDFYSIFILIFFSFNNLTWLVMTGQLMQFEILFFLIGITLLNTKFKKLSVLSFLLFGIKSYYFLIISFYFSFKFYKFKGILANVLLLVSLSIVNIDLFNDYFKFWFSEEGYLFGERVGFHSFFNERFDNNSPGFMTLLKSIFNYFDFVPSKSFMLLIYIFIFFVFLYCFLKYSEKYLSRDVQNFFILYFFILFHPLLKPYTFIFLSIVILFLLNEIKVEKYQLLVLYLTVIPPALWLMLNNFLYTNTNYPLLTIVNEAPISLSLLFQYRVLESSLLVTSIILLIYISKKLRLLNINDD